MGAISIAYSHPQLLGFSPTPIGSVGNTGKNVRSRASSGITLGLTVDESTIGRSSNRRRRLCPISIHLRCSRSYPSHRCSCSSQLIPDLAVSTSALYGGILLAGGLFAYTKSGSKGSLSGGLVGATIMSAAYYLMQASETREIGDAIAFGAALLFSFVFGIRFAATRKLIPAGLLLGISIGVMAISVSAYLQDRI